FYNSHRPHRALDQAAPLRPLPDRVTDLDHFRVRRHDRAGGVIHEYRLVAWAIRGKSGESRSTSIIPAVRIAGPSSRIWNISRLARTRSDSGSACRWAIGSRLDWWLDTTT